MIQTIEYSNRAAYNSGTTNLTSSLISRIAEEDKVEINLINTVTRQPKVGDAVFKTSSGQKVFIDGDTINKNSLDKNWEFIGVVYKVENGGAKVLSKTTLSGVLWCNVVLYGIKNITGNSITLLLRLSNDYANYTSITVTGGTSMEDWASKIASAVLSKNTTYNWWAKYDSTNSRIILQKDTWNNWLEYYCAATGCSISFISLEELPKSNNYYRGNYIATNYRGWLYLPTFVNYFKTNGETPTSQWPVMSTSANLNPVKYSEFTNSSYCSDLRKAYPGSDKFKDIATETSTSTAYVLYIYTEYKIIYPSNLGVFSLQNAEYMRDTFSETQVTLKDGTTKFKYPALRAYKSLGSEWHLLDVPEAVELFSQGKTIRDAFIRVLGSSPLALSGTYYWLSRVYNAFSCWSFNGTTGDLNYNYGSNGYAVLFSAFIAL